MIVLNVENSRLLDELTVKNGSVTIRELIKSSGECIAGHIADNFSKTSAILFVCGKGNNGADGIAAAIILHNQGYNVSIFIPSIQLSEETMFYYNEALAQNIVIVSEIGEYDIYIDGLLGTGFSGEIKGEYLDIIEKINNFHDTGKTVIAIDIPSGVNGDSGEVNGAAIKADMTLALAALKTGYYLHDGADFTGEVTLFDIGISHDIYAQVEVVANVINESDVKKLLPKRYNNSYKGSSGYLLTIAGSVGMLGAAITAIRSSYYSGAGLVSAAAAEDTVLPLNTAFSDAVYVELPNNPNGKISYRSLPVLLEKVKECNAALIGPGMDITGSRELLVADFVKNAGLPLVIDASALTAIAKNNPQKILSARKYETILTPHPGEMARLLNRPIKECEENRIETAKQAAREFDSVVVYKGGKAVIAAPDGRVYINPAGNGALAVAGTGDMLAGIISGLLAGGLTAFDAAIIGAYIGGKCAEEYIKNNCIISGTATDLVSYVPYVLHCIENQLDNI